MLQCCAASALRGLLCRIPTPSCSWCSRSFRIMGAALYCHSYPTITDVLLASQHTISCDYISSLVVYKSKSVDNFYVTFFKNMQSFPANTVADGVHGHWCLIILHNARSTFSSVNKLRNSKSNSSNPNSDRVNFFVVPQDQLGECNWRIALRPRYK